MNDFWVMQFGSVGSLGKYQNEADVVGVVVRNCTISNTQNGVRVKTWPGSPESVASNFTFEDIVMINVSNPIIIDQEYCPSGSCEDSGVNIYETLHLLYAFCYIQLTD